MGVDVLMKDNEAVGVNIYWRKSIVAGRRQMFFR